MITDYDPTSQPWIDWAKRARATLGGGDSDNAGALQTLHRLISTTEGDNIIQLYYEKVKEVVTFQEKGSF